MERNLSVSLIRRSLRLEGSAFGQYGLLLTGQDDFGGAYGANQDKPDRLTDRFFTIHDKCMQFADNCM